MEKILLGFFASFVISFLVIPIVIRIAKRKNILDTPKQRSVHSESIPTLGGLAFLLSSIIVLLIWGEFQSDIPMRNIIIALVLLGVIGISDDLLDLLPLKKLMGQIAVSTIVVASGVRITSFYGILGINTLPEVASIPFTIFTFLVIINAFNLIDGINGLASSIAIVSSCCFGVYFYQIDAFNLTLISFTLTGSLIAFLRYNLSPAKIFMGDTGSLILGFINAILAVYFIEFNYSEQSKLCLDSAPTLAISFLIYPLFDLLRSFSIRIKNGKSPFSADQNHIHHLLLKAKASHRKSTFIIVLFSITTIGIALLVKPYGNYAVGFSSLALCLLFVFGIQLIIKRSNE